MAVVIHTTFQFKRGLADDIAYVNPLLAAGEPCYELDTGKLKIGNGELDYNSLPYFGGEFSISVDNSSLEINLDGEIQVFGFGEAVIGTIPVKGEEDLEWKTVDELMVDYDKKTDPIEVARFSNEQNVALVIDGGGAPAPAIVD